MHTKILYSNVMHENVISNCNGKYAMIRGDTRMVRDTITMKSLSCTSKYDSCSYHSLPCLFLSPCSPLSPRMQSRRLYRRRRRRRRRWISSRPSDDCRLHYELLYCSPFAFQHRCNSTLYELRKIMVT